MTPDIALLLVHAVIGVTVAEGVFLLAWHARTGRGPRANAIVANLMAGLCLMLALRSVLAGSSWAACALWLAAAGAAHAIDLRRRWPPALLTRPSGSAPATPPAHQGPP
ncbi:hypothetical protein AACH06_10770 [Ideonella sp. DXS29W]|uniref:DUF3325 domain-containing protein n=1 Tax=Ideonella lacteola TaxID=2984193 RepID=A0ABU9BMV6_9BURK